MLVEHGAAEARGNGFNELVAAQDAGDIGVVEDALSAGQAQGGAGDDNGFGQRGMLAVVNGIAALEGIGKNAAEREVAVLGQ